MSKDRYLSEAALKDKPIKRFTIKIKDSSVTTQKLANGSITTEKLADKSVTNEKIAQGAITSEKIAYDAIRSEHIDYGAVGTEELFDNCVQTEKILDDAVTTEKLADGSVVNKKLAPNSVSATKIADQAVLISKIADEVWAKLRGEYLGLDGTKSMEGHLSLGGNGIYNVNSIYQYSSFGAVISLSETDEIILKTIEVDGSAEPYHRILADFKEGEVSFPDGNVLTKGYKTIDRTNIGLLVNDGSVGLAMTDSDIDAITSSVFTNYVNAD